MHKTIPDSYEIGLLVRDRSPKSDRIPSNLSEYSGEVILDWYRTTNQHQLRINQLQNQEWPMKHHECVEVGGRFAGVVFEDLAYFYMASQCEEDEVLLTPAETFSFFRSKYKGHTRNYLFGNSDISGVSVPDGLLLRRNASLWEVRLICEYTVSSNYDYLDIAEERKAPARENFRHDMPALFGKSEAAYIVPNDSNLRSTFMSRHRHVLTTPFNYKAFRNLTTLMHSEVGMNMYFQTLQG